MDDFVTAGEQLHNVARADLLHDIEYGLKYRYGKPTNAGRDIAFGNLATLVLDHLELAGYVFKRKPPISLETSRVGSRMKD